MNSRSRPACPDPKPSVAIFRSSEQFASVSGYSPASAARLHHANQRLIQILRGVKIGKWKRG